MDEIQSTIDRFLKGSSFAVVGASRDRSKYGNKVLRAYLQKGMTVFPVNPTAGEVEGLKAYPNLTSLPQTVDGISIVTPPHVTEEAVEEACRLGIKHIWMQPGAESKTAIDRAKACGAEVIAEGPCVLVMLGYRES